MKANYFLITLLLLTFWNICFGQLPWTEDFEGTTSPAYTTSTPEFSDIGISTGYDFFTNTSNNSFNANVVYNSANGNYFAAMDIDGELASPIQTLTWSSIDISGCNSLLFSIDIAEDDNGTNENWDDPDYVHIMYSIDGGPLTNLLWIEADSFNGSGTNTFPSVDTNFDGVGDGTVITSTFQTFNNISISGIGSTLDIIIEFNLDSGDEDLAIDNLSVSGTCVNNTINTVSVIPNSGSTFDVNCDTPLTEDGTITFTTTGTFNAGNTFNLELSNASGSFPISNVIGTSSASPISFTIPSDLNSGTYDLRIVSTDPVVVSDVYSSITANQTGACIPSIPAFPGLIINEWSNGPSGTQAEYYEFVVAGQCGETTDIRGFILDDNNGTFTNPSDYSSNASGIAPGHFRFAYDPQWANIPVGSLIVVYNADEPNPTLPTDDENDSNNDLLYVVPHTSSLFERCLSLPSADSPDSIYAPCTYALAPLTGWGPLSLRNNGDAIQVRNPDGSYYHGVSYGGSEITGGPHGLKLFSGSGSTQCGWFNDGDFFDVSNWDYGPISGNQTPGLPNNALNQAWLDLMRDPTGTTCPIDVLPIEMSSFDGKCIGRENVLYWTTESEINSDFFIVERSSNGQEWSEVGRVSSSGNSSVFQYYSLSDLNYENMVNYYRLSQTDIDGTKEVFNRLVVIDNSMVKETKLVGIFNLLGQKIEHDTPGVQIHLFDDGSVVKIFK